MIPFDMTVSFVAGQTLALAARRQLKKEESLFFNRPLYISLLWMVILYAPSAMFFYHGWTAWNIMYIFDPYPLPAKDPTLASSILIWLDCTTLTLILMGGFALAHTWIRKGRERLAIISPIIAVLALVLFLAITYHRGFIVTSYAEFKASVDEGLRFTWGGNSFWGHDVFWANAVIMFIDFGPLAYLYYWFNKEGKK
ncbi:MAG: hypothetical protein AAB266_05105 [Nitrospirota bacterium]